MSSRNIATNEISIYKGGIISNESIIKYSIKIRYAFPALPPEFYDVLLEMVKEENFTDERFRDSVHYVIKNCHYPTPTIADFISFDRRFKVFTYDEMLKKLDEMGGDRKIWDSYKRIKLPGRPEPVWIHVNDIAMYKIKSE